MVFYMWKWIYANAIKMYCSLGVSRFVVWFLKGSTEAEYEHSWAYKHSWSLKPEKKAYMVKFAEETVWFFFWTPAKTFCKFVAGSASTDQLRRDTRERASDCHLLSSGYNSFLSNFKNWIDLRVLGIVAGDKYKWGNLCAYALSWRHYRY
jgi:hypothetical protein